MLSGYPNVNLPSGNKPTFLETQTKKRRLADIKRGQAYFQQLDKLAGRQWSRNTPHDSAGRRQTIHLRPLTDTRQTMAKSRQLMLDRNENKRIHSEKPRASERMIEEDLAYSNLTTPRQRANGLDLRIQSPYFRNGCAEKIGERLGVFNKWGSGIHPLDEKIALTAKDLAPQFEPFRFRDSIKHVYKPAPKQYSPMSRVGHEKDRQIKVHTNFLTKNGIVNILPDIEQWPDISYDLSQKSFVQETTETLEREKTSAFMCRLNKIIDPYKQHTDNPEITSSDEECKGSPPPSISELSEVKKSIQSKSPRRKDSDATQKLPLFPKYLTQQPQRGRRKNFTFSKMLVELDKNPIGSSKKCKIWVKNLERINC